MSVYEKIDDLYEGLDYLNEVEAGELQRWAYLSEHFRDTCTNVLTEKQAKAAQAARAAFQEVEPEEVRLFASLSDLVTGLQNGLVEYSGSFVVESGASTSESENGDVAMAD
jgi:hypothetical protein